MVLDEQDTSHRGDGQSNDQYYAWGKKVVAPGAGTIVAMENGVEDNEPGAMNPEQLLGNYVFLDHGNGEYSLIAHFQKGSIKVKQGEVVERGALLGLVGNSGNSSEAHIHYHMETGPGASDGRGAADPVRARDDRRRGIAGRGARAGHEGRARALMTHAYRLIVDAAGGTGCELRIVHKVL